MSTIKAGGDRLAEACRDRALTAHLITDYSKANQCEKAFVNSNPGDLGQTSKEERLRGEAWAKYGQQLEALINCGIYGPDADSASAEKVKLEGTDVFSAMMAAEEVMNGLPEPRTMFVISDMRNTMPPLKTPPKGKVADAVEKLDESGQIPNLAGVNVVVVGSGSSNKLTPKQNARLVSFWEKYFEAADAASVSFQQSIS